MESCKPSGSHWYIFVVLFLTLIASSSSNNEEDSGIFSYQDLIGSGGERFSSDGVTSYGPLLFDVARDQLFVGSRDNLFRLSLRGLNVIEHAQWKANIDKAVLCQDKGQTEAACHNYIKILLSDGRRLFTCGTGAFSPVCSWRQLENVSHVIEPVKGLAKCPYNPEANITALLTMEGQYYVGTPTDFSGSDHAIYRAFGSNGDQTLRTSQYNSKWLNEPQFVGSFEDDKFVYFIFRETAVEYINCGKKIYSRIARVCKNDSGGQLMLRDNWTTFVKARLNCSLPGEYPFYYDEVQGIEYLPQQRLLYATFTTPRNSIAGSAICIFNMSAIDEAFRGPFKHQEHPGAAWESIQARHHPHGHCTTSSSRPQQLTDSSRYQLMDLAVQSSTLKPLHTADLERYSFITVAQLTTAHAALTNMLFVATENGLVKKLSIPPGSDLACVIEVWKPQANSLVVPIKSLQYLKETESIYLSTDEEVMRIPIARCSRFVSRDGCLASGDPLCGWDNRREICTVAPSLTYPLPAYWKQLPPGCPDGSASLDGGWSGWSGWEVCSQHGEGLEESEDKCLCQTRTCTNPTPKNGGKGCSGTSIRVTNCTVHGGWTVWSGWSACSATCGVAVKWRRRTCSAPPQAHGGRVCVGSDREEIYCTGISPCPAPVVPVIEGGWSDWTPWSSCSSPCGSGVRWRSRRCDSPKPPEPPEGLPCQGCSTQAEVCNAHPCEYKRISIWTPWFTLHTNTTDNGLVEKRFKYSCKAQRTENIKISLIKEEERAVGTGDSEADSWSAWSSWGDCTVECGGGFQTASRKCLKPPCQGSSNMQRVCNVHSCIDGWGCWSEWSTCSSTCGYGHQERARPCLFPQGCTGDSKQVRACQIVSCEEAVGWSEWSAWSDCNTDGEQKRVRECETSTCQGPSQQTRPCIEDDYDNDFKRMVVHQPSVIAAGVIGMGSGMSPGWVAGAALAGLVSGAALVAFAVFAWGRHRPSRIPSTPLYITQPNSYVSVPLKEAPKKRQPSFSGLTLSKTNNLNTNNAGLKTPKLYPKAMAGDYESTTLKRNSNSNCRNNIDLEQEKFY